MKKSSVNRARGTHTLGSSQFRSFICGASDNSLTISVLHCPAVIKSFLSSTLRLFESGAQNLLCRCRIFYCLFLFCSPTFHRSRFTVK